MTKEERAQIIRDDALGAGNVIHRLKAYGRPLDEHGAVDRRHLAGPGRHPSQLLTLGELHEIVEQYAGWYHAQGVRPRDPVAIHTYSSTEFAINFLALTSLGAIPSFVNGNLRPEIAREYVRRQGAVGAITDVAHDKVLSENRAELGLGFCGHRRRHPRMRTAKLPLPGRATRTRTTSTDPIIISHSSGTTGMPKAVPHTHETLLYAQLHRLRLSTGLLDGPAAGRAARLAQRGDLGHALRLPAALAGPAAVQPARHRRARQDGVLPPHHGLRLRRNLRGDGGADLAPAICPASRPGTTPETRRTRRTSMR
jgi:acyl-CoA synthetase (AMP-forming)/AMP-acid ligase II